MADARTQGLVYGPTDVITTEVSAVHTISLALQGSSWKVVSDQYLDPFNQTLEADHTTPVPAAQPPSESATSTPGTPNMAKAAVAAATTVTYDRIAARGYADKYWNKYNPNYLNYNSSGGDCANFVSQSMWDPVDGANLPSVGTTWTYNGGTNLDKASPIAWRYVPSFHKFLISNPQGAAYDFGSLGKKGTYSATLAYDKANVLLGDVNMYDWDSDGVLDHTAITSSYLSDGTTLVDAHNTNEYHARYDLGESGATIYLDRIKNVITVK